MELQIVERAIISRAFIVLYMAKDLVGVWDDFSREGSPHLGYEELDALFAPKVLALLDEELAKAEGVETLEQLRLLLEDSLSAHVYVSRVVEAIDRLLLPQIRLAKTLAECAALYAQCSHISKSEARKAARAKLKRRVEKVISEANGAPNTLSEILLSMVPERGLYPHRDTTFEDMLCLHLTVVIMDALPKAETLEECDRLAGLVPLDRRGDGLTQEVINRKRELIALMLGTATTFDKLRALLRATPKLPGKDPLVDQFIREAAKIYDSLPAAT